jgi:hypothetical protein
MSFCTYVDALNEDVVDDRDEMNFFDGHDRFDENAFRSQSVLLESQGMQKEFTMTIGESYGREWLLDQCEQHVALYMPQSGFTGSQLSANVLDVLRSSQSGIHYLVFKHENSIEFFNVKKKTILRFLCWVTCWALRISVSLRH